MKSNVFFTENLAKDDLVAAPLAGISHLPFRRILRKYFKGIIYSEMMSTEGIMRQNPESMEYLDRVDGESPLVFQLFGGKPLSFSEAIKIAENTVNVEAFDVNMGCPVKKVLKAGGGCSLLQDIPRLKEIVKVIRKSTDKPFSIKIRVGLDEKKMVYNEVADIAQSEGADALIVHARTRAQMFGGTPRLEILNEITSRFTIPVIGNGGVCDAATYADMKATGVKGVMIGRAMMKSPWIFKALREGKSYENFLTPLEVKDLILEMWEYMLEHANERENKRTHYTHMLRKFAVWFSKGLENAADFRVKIYQTKNEEEVLETINNFFGNAGYFV